MQKLIKRWMDEALRLRKIAYEMKALECSSLLAEADAYEVCADELKVATAKPPNTPTRGPNRPIWRTL